MTSHHQHRLNEKQRLEAILEILQSCKEDFKRANYSCVQIEEAITEYRARYVHVAKKKYEVKCRC